jgi:hypothetical protein
MHKKSPRDIEFAIRLAIDALHREIDHRNHATQLALDDSVLQQYRIKDRQIRQPDKHRRDLERAIAILKAIKAGYYE